MTKPTKNILAAVLAVIPVYFLLQFFVPVYDNAALFEVEIEIPQGANYKKAADILAEKRLIRDKLLFLALGRITGADKKMRAGYYYFRKGTTPFEVFQQLRQGKIIEYNITVVEGDGLREIAAKLEAKKLISAKAFIDLSRDAALLSSLNIISPSVEGYLFPDTYKLPKGMQPGDIVKMMVDHLRQSYTDEIKTGMEKAGWKENDVLTLASIIEKEAVIDDERPIISAVYHNRLRKGMPLQADPTAIYGVKSSKSKITVGDLRNKTAYNTYVIKGLPPGPIASPGLKSIRAALFPAKAPYIYFVSRGDGSHIFSATLSEHNKAVKKVRASATEDNGKGKEQS